MPPDDPKILEIILDEMREMRTENRTTQRSIAALQVDVGKLSVKAGVWGVMGGLLPAIGAVLFVLLQN